MINGDIKCVTRKAARHLMVAINLIIEQRRAESQKKVYGGDMNIRVAGNDLIILNGI